MSEKKLSSLVSLGFLPLKIINNVFHPVVILYCIFPDKIPSNPAETVLRWYAVFIGVLAVIMTSLMIGQHFTVKYMKNTLETLSRHPDFKEPEQETEKRIDRFHFYFHLLISSVSAFCLIFFKSYYITGGLIIYSNIISILMMIKKESLTLLRFEKNKWIMEAERKRKAEGMKELDNSKSE